MKQVLKHCAMVGVKTDIDFEKVISICTFSQGSVNFLPFSSTIPDPSPLSVKFRVLMC
jgi:hypothetical protein